MIEKIVYPDGQINVRIDLNNQSPRLKLRINSYEDLFYLKSITEVTKSNCYPIVELFIPCLFGQRSDRRFQQTESFGLKIIADFINSCEIPTVKIFDPHSDVSLALINNSERISSEEFVLEAIKEIRYLDSVYEGLVLVSPDAGAYKKVFSFAEKFNKPLVAANKFRDLEGNVTLNILGDVKGKLCLIVDDLADGGYTFHVLAKQLKEQGAKKVFLYVSHAYFNKGFETLKENIDHIFCTNSVKDIEDDFVTQFKIV